MKSKHTVINNNVVVALYENEGEQSLLDLAIALSHQIGKKGIEKVLISGVYYMVQRSPRLDITIFFEPLVKNKYIHFYEFEGEELAALNSNLSRREK